ncbi:MAG: ArsA family ATPase [Desulfobacterales bacterium]
MKMMIKRKDETETGMAVPSFLRDRPLQLVFFGGKGGVGKTTSAAATALRYARDNPQYSFLLVSTDPAHSLADSLTGLALPGNLKILELDARQCLAAFKKKHDGDLREIAVRGTFLDDEDISQFLALSLPGLDELMAFLEISRSAEDGPYDCIVVDTAPTGHTLRFLAMPELIKKWLEALDALLAKHRYMKQLFSGAYIKDELDDFLLNLSDSVKKMEALIGDPSRCRFVPVMLAEVLSIHETLALLAELKRSKIPVTDIVVNMLYPENSCAVCLDRHNQQIKALGRLSDKMSGYSLWGIPMYPQEVRGPGPLDMFWENVSLLKVPIETSVKDQSGFRFPVSGTVSPVGMPGRPPSPETRLILFAGKGGVGKTTLACATAVRMARDPVPKEVFIFSTDPAHSLSACLDADIGPRPTRLTAGLTAMEIDARAEFEILKKQYAAELEQFLSSVSSNLDLAFDREVMERVMDLSPPGLDEVMALTSVMEFLANDRYHVFILDAAPTGHLIRLLETPELIDRWLKVFFNLFLKYKRVFRLPGISCRMVRMSKELKVLQTLLRDPRQSALFTVAIPTDMAFEETKALLSACNRIGIHAPTLFLNLATPDGKCSLCSALYQRESQLGKKYQRAFSQMHQTLIYRRTEPRGLERLGELGETLYDSRMTILDKDPPAMQACMPARRSGLGHERAGRHGLSRFFN